MPTIAKLLESEQKKLVKEIEAFLAATGMPPSRFGTEVANDTGIVFDLRKGKRRLTPEKIEAISRYIARHSPGKKAVASRSKS
jgi:hypothetical protein